MMKRILPLLLAALLCIAVAAPISAFAEDSVPTKAQAVSGVAFKTQLGSSGVFIRYLKTGEIVTVLGVPNPYWYQVKDANGVTGYVSSNEKYTRIVSNALVIYGVNFRTGPSTADTVIRMLPKGEELLVLEKVNDGWLKVRDTKGVTGYVSSNTKYLTINTDSYKMVLPLQDRIESYISEAMKYIGTPYEYGSTRFDPSTLDCSDLVQQAYWDTFKESFPSGASGQADYVKRLGPVVTDWKNLKRGDLMFFMSYKGSKASSYSGINKTTEPVTHVGIYLGNGQLLHTYSIESGGVKLDTIGANTWEYRFLFGGSFTQ